MTVSGRGFLYLPRPFLNSSMASFTKYMRCVVDDLGPDFAGPEQQIGQRVANFVFRAAS